MSRIYSDWHAMPDGRRVRFSLVGAQFNATWDPGPPEQLAPVLASYTKARDTFCSECAKRTGLRIGLLGPTGACPDLYLVTYTPHGGMSTQPLT